MKELNKITVKKIMDISTVHSLRGRCFEMERRPVMGLTFCKDGKITYSQHGREIVSDRSHAVILPQGASYTLYGNETGNFPLINFTCEGFSPDTVEAVRLASVESYLRDFERMHSLSLFEGNRAAVMSIFYDIVSRLSREESSEFDILSPAICFIEQNYADPTLSNSLLAELCGISEVYFRRIFLRARGETPKQYIIGIRIRRAKQLLGERETSVGEISELCGFSSVYHFCRAFKNITGQTPTEYAAGAAKIGI